MGEEAGSKKSDTVLKTMIGSSVIRIINRLRDIPTPVSDDLLKISLPQVAVVGCQSSGKSSVLEALVGHDFLPRGCDICTRRALVLMLENRTRKPDDDGGEWAEFSHLPGKRFYDFAEVRREILAETDKEAGNNKGVSNKQIHLKISSPNVLDMTLIDLPGITKVPVGDQPSDIEAKIRQMIMMFIKQENCIILAVCSANSDLATSDALLMAREADPTGSRTIGVITKLDIMDRGTDACNFLLDKVVPLRLGYIGVVNRSQADINKSQSIRDALAYEEQFFLDHPVYNALSDRCGIPQLAKKLNQILKQHIKIVLPGLKAELNSRLIAVAKELQKYGKDLESKAEQETVLLSILSRFCEAFSAMVDGKSREMSTKELSGGARIHYIFQSIFVKTLEEVDPCQDLTDEDICTAIQNATGPRNALFVPEAAFESLVRRQISRLLDPSVQCLRFVYDELIKMSRACEVTELQRFPVLRRRLDDVTAKFLRDCVRPAEIMIRNLIETEMDYINSSHPNFIGGNKAIELTRQQLRSLEGNHSQSNNQRAVSAGDNSSPSRTWGFSSIFGSRVQDGESPASVSPSETLDTIKQLPSTIQLQEPPSMIRPLEMIGHEAVEIMVTKLLLQSYYDIVRRNVQDLVPKAIMHFLVNHAKRDLHKTFMQKLYRDNHIEELLEECGDVIANRKHAKEMYHVLQQAVQTLDDIEYDVSSGNLNSTSGVDTTTGLSRIPDISLHTSAKTNGIHVPLYSLKKCSPKLWEQPLVGSTFWALSDRRLGIWGEPDLESSDGELKMGEVDFRDERNSAKLGIDAMKLSECALKSDEEENTLSSERSDSSDYEEDSPPGLGFDVNTNFEGGLQTNNVIAKWKSHASSIASKMMAKIGYGGASGQGILNPSSVEVLPPKQSLDQTLESHQSVEGKESRVKKRSRDGKSKLEKKSAVAAARGARDEEGSRPEVFTLSSELAMDNQTVNVSLPIMLGQKGSAKEENVWQRDLVAYDDEVDLRIRVEKLEEMVLRGKKEKAVYEAAVRNLRETRKALVEAEAARAYASDEVASRVNKEVMV